MDHLDDYSLYALNYPELSDSESTVSDENNIIIRHKRSSHHHGIDHWQCIYDDELWYMYSMLKDYIKFANLSILDKLSYSTFVFMCYENSSPTHKYVSMSRLFS